MQRVDITVGQVTFSAVLDRELVLLRVTDLLAARGSIAAERLPPPEPEPPTRPRPPSPPPAPDRPRSARSKPQPKPPPKPGNKRSRGGKRWNRSSKRRN